MPAVSSSAIANLVILAGGRPIFADIEAPHRPFLEAADANRLVGPRTRALLTVHEAGVPAPHRRPGPRRRRPRHRPYRRLPGGARRHGRRPPGRLDRQLATFAFGGSPSAGGLISTAAENLERHLIALRSTVIATDDECFSHDCADGMVNGYRIDEAAASAGARVLAGLTEAIPPAAASWRRRRTGGCTPPGWPCSTWATPPSPTGSGLSRWRPHARAPRRGRVGLQDRRRRGRHARGGLCPARPVAPPGALPNTRAFCDLALKFAVVPGLDARLAAAL